MAKKVIVIGAGFAGISAAAHLAKKGYDVTILEKNKIPGGRARVFKKDGFTFDMGPSWYWMPEVFEHFFNAFGKSVKDFYALKRLNPSYRIVFGLDKKEWVDVPAQMDDLRAMFESYEKGSAKNLDKFLKEAAYKYEVGMNEFVYKPSLSLLEFADIRVFKSLFKLQMFTSIDKQINQLFQHKYLRELLKFPVLFLGAKPENTPAMYSLMNHADLALGTWYPMGGMHKIIEGMVAVAKQQGVNLLLDHAVTKIEVNNGQASKIHCGEQVFEADIIVGGADYEHIDQKLLPKSVRNYTPEYWDKRTMAPSSLLFYLGVNKRIPNLKHHNLFFDEDFTQHAVEIYDDPKWPSKPLFYACVPSKTDETVAPEGMENIFLLVPVAPDLEDTPEIRATYFDKIMKRLEAHCGTSIKDAIVYQRSFAHNDFKADYNAFKGNAYGLANTLKQTAILKPSLKNKHIRNFFYTGQLTTPGPGVPPSIISGEVVANEVYKAFKP